jgi:O-antigen/teichoic acid export membrane protein
MGGLVLVPVMVLLSLTSQQVVPVVFGHQWAPAAAVASALAVRSLVRELSQFNGSVLMATGHPSSELVVTVTTLVLQIGVVVVLAHHLVALALALAACQAVGIPIRVVLVRRYFGVPLSTYARAAAVCLAGGLAAGAVVGAQVLLQLPGPGYVALAVLLGGAVYLGVALLVTRSLVLEALGAVRATLTHVLRRRGAASQA